MAKLRQSRAEIDGCGRFTDAAFLVRNRDDSHNLGANGRDYVFVPPSSPDDVAGRAKQELNFSDFGFGTFEVDFGFRPPSAGSLYRKLTVSPTDTSACGGRASVGKVKPLKC